MLFIGSKLYVRDNSGASIIKIINLKLKKTYQTTFITTGAFCLGVIKKHKLYHRRKRKGLKKKSLVNTLVVAVKKKTSRKNGFYINFNRNYGLPIEFRIKMYQTCGNRVFIPVLRDFKRRKGFKQIIIRARKVF